MTKKERKINKRNILVMNNFNKLCDEESDVLVENYNSKTAGAYGLITDMVPDYKLAKRLYLAGYGEWGEVYLTTAEIVPSLEIYRSIDVFSYVKKSDIQEIWKKRYVILKRGGVYDLFTGFWYKRKDFFNRREAYNRNVKCYKAKLNSYKKFIEFARNHINNWLVDKIGYENPYVKYTFDDNVLCKMAEEVNGNIDISDVEFISALVSALISTDATGKFGINSRSIVDDTFEYDFWEVLYNIEDSIKGYTALDEMNDLIDSIED